MNVETRRAQRSTYQGRRTKKKKSGIWGKIKVVLGIFVLVAAFNLLFPNTSAMIGDKISPSFDYRSAFSDIGSAITGEEKVTDVLGEIVGGGYKKETATEPATESVTRPYEPTTPSGIVSDDPGIVPSVLPASLNGEPTEKMNASGQGYVSLSTSESDDTEEFFEELLLKLPSTETDEGASKAESAPEAVSFDYVVIEFDYITPVQGTITSEFGYRIHPISKKKSFHYGLDIANSSGTAIQAFANGTVESIGYNSVYGNYLFIRHKSGIITFYGHCKKVLVEEGQLVLMGDHVADMGNTGLSTGPHLHFEVRNGETNLDPIHYVSLENS